MTTNEILSLVRTKALEAGSEVVSEPTLLIYVNLAHRDVIKRAFPNNSVETATITFTNGVGTLPTNFGTLYTDAYDSDGNIFNEVSISDFIRLNGEPAIVIENDTIKVSPDTKSSLNIKYYPDYAALTNIQNPTIDEYLHEPIVYGALSRVIEDLQDPELSQFYLNKYEKMLTDRLSHISNYEETGQSNVMFNQIRIL